jgi:hypothetical protein
VIKKLLKIVIIPKHNNDVRTVKWAFLAHVPSMRPSAVDAVLLRAKVIMKRKTSSGADD